MQSIKSTPLRKAFIEEIEAKGQELGSFLRLLAESSAVAEACLDAGLSAAIDAHAHGANEAQAAPEPEQWPDWRPIETAPKDSESETNILLAGPKPDGEWRVTEGYWLDDPEALANEAGEMMAPFWWSTDGGFTAEWPPTHWMPLPTPPARGDGDAA